MKTVTFPVLDSFERLSLCSRIHMVLFSNSRSQSLRMAYVYRYTVIRLSFYNIFLGRIIFKYRFKIIMSNEKLNDNNIMRFEEGVWGYFSSRIVQDLLRNL